MLAPSPQTNRVTAALTCLSAIPFPYLGPTVAVLAAGRNPEVRYYALRLLIEQVRATVVLALLLALSLGFSIYQLVQSGVFEGGIQWSRIDWWGILIKSAATWIGLLLWNLWNVFNSVREALQVFRGKPIEPRKWAERKAAALARI